MRAILFDAFGTLFDTGSGGSARETILSHLRADGASVDETAFRSEWTEFYRIHTAPEAGFRTERALFGERIRMFYRRYGIKRDAAADSDSILQGAYTRKAFPEAADALSALRKKYQVLIASNTDNDVLEQVMTRNRIAADGIYTSENLKCYKPNPDFYRKILNDAGLSPQEVLFVGDSVRDDILGPKTVGIAAVWVNRNGKTEDFGQIATVSDLRELLEIVKKFP